MTTLRLLPATNDTPPQNGNEAMQTEIHGYLTHMRLQGASDGYLAATRDALLRLARALPVAALSDATAEQLLGWRATLAVGPETIVNYVGYARRFYDWAITAGRCAANPAAAIPVPRRPSRLPRPIPTGELLDVLAAAPRRIRLWIVLSAWAGLRAKEIALLRAENIHIDGPRPFLIVAANATKGSRERVVALCPFAVAEIRAAHLPRRGWAFTRRDGQAGPNTPGRVSRLICGHYRACGITSTGHAGRHWFATEFYEASGHDLLATQQALGHARAETTAVYAKVRPAAASAAVLKLPVPQSRRPRRMRAAG